MSLIPSALHSGLLRVSHEGFLQLISCWDMQNLAVAGLDLLKPSDTPLQCYQQLHTLEKDFGGIIVKLT